MDQAIAEVIAVVALVATLATAVARPRGINEAVIAVPSAVLLVVVGVAPWPDAWATVVRFGPPVIFLAAILLFGQLCADAGVFAYFGDRAGRAARGRPRRLLALVVALAATVTVTLTLDATIVLVTPVVLRAAMVTGARARPHLYANVRLANSASLLLPVSNLTNLLAYRVADLSFGRFALLMALPWVAVCLAEWSAVRYFFRRDLPGAAPPGSGDTGSGPRRSDPAGRADDAGGAMPRRDTVARGGEPQPTPPPRYALTVAVVTIVAVLALVAAHRSPAWAALAGSAVLLVPRLRARSVSPRRVLAALHPGFCVFVLALAVVVDAVTRHGLGSVLAAMVPSGTSYGAVLGMVVLAAVLANVVNNLPATLALLPLVAHHPPLVLAMLIGVNVGPNLSYGGSLATLLWRRVLPVPDRPRPTTFHAFAAATVPVILVAAGSLLWVALRLWPPAAG